MRSGDFLFYSFFFFPRHSENINSLKRQQIKRTDLDSFVQLGTKRRCCLKINTDFMVSSSNVQPKNGTEC